MFFNRSDNLFLEAAQDDAKLENLLLRFKRLRVSAMRYLFVSLALAGILTGWLIFEVLNVLKTPKLEFPSYLGWTIDLGPGPVIFVSMGLLAYFNGLIDMSLGADARVKTLLMYRESRKRGAA